MDNMEIFVVTGSKGVIGREISRKLREEGFEVFGIDIAYDVTQGEEEILSNQSGGNWKQDFLLFLTKNPEYKLKGLLLAHGLHEIGSEIAPKDFRRHEIIESNFFSTVEYVDFFQQHLSQNSQIIYLGSIVALIPLPFSALYSASKAAVYSYLISLERVFISQGIRLKFLTIGNINSGFNEKGHHQSSKDLQTIKVELERVAKFIHSSRGIQVDKVTKKIVKMIKNDFTLITIYGRNAKLLNTLLRVIGFNVTWRMINLILFGPLRLYRKSK